MQILLVSTKKQILKHLNEILNNQAQECRDMSMLELAIFKAAKDNSIICMDVSSMGDDAIDTIEHYLAQYPTLRILALSQNPNLMEGSKLLEVGVKGYVNSRLYDTHLKDAIKAISDGNVWVYPEFIYSMVKMVSKKTNPQKTNLDILTPKEKDVANLVLDGLSNKQIAQTTGVSERTVKAHISSIYSKFNVKDRIGFVIAMEDKG
ncbi:response regulator transcription factor [Campylobacter sp. 19-13652]|uniref:response regulator transcription factor n=1 Tax=Campylobacter sp. 19-13652 TaxID=2840180 RepID=UPI001C784B44|nr:response regulator transcription factor [Campylobacter sp. 19-13652]BCX79008.1 DNA-binding response regulator [Campylobacter sp. 19-13652]